MNDIKYSNYFDKSLIQKIILIVIYALLLFSLIDFIGDRIRIKNEKLVIFYLKGSVTNPVSFWNAAQYYESNKDYKRAVSEINFAIGILTNNSSSVDVIKPYISKAIFYCGNLAKDNDDCELLINYIKNYEKAKNNR